MARGRSSGAGYAVALVIIGFLFFVTVIFAVIFYVQFDTARLEAQQAQEQLAVFVTRDDQQKSQIAALQQAASRGGDSVVGRLYNENRYLKNTILGDPDVELGDYESGEDIISKNKKDNRLSLALFNEIQTMLATINDGETRQKELRTQLAAEQAKFAQLAKARQESLAAYEKAAQSLKQDVDQAAAGIAANAQKADEKLNELQQQITTETQQYLADKSELQSAKTELEDRNTQLQIIVDRMTNQNRNRTQISNVTKGDGNILSMDDETQSVYINRGGDDQVLLGMTFEVFNPDTLIKLDETKAIRGKATVEVFEVNETTSRARIVRKDRGAFIKSGDTIANLVYDPNKTFKFYIHGNFDIDKDGTANRSELRRIEALVRDWGGQVVDQLDYDVDFLILGERPEFPAPLGSDVIDLAKIRDREKQVEVFNTYTDLEATAKKLSIPVLNQNRFYSLIGLYEQR